MEDKGWCKGAQRAVSKAARSLRTLHQEETLQEPDTSSFSGRWLWGGRASQLDMAVERVNTKEGEE